MVLRSRYECGTMVRRAIPTGGEVLSLEPGVTLDRQNTTLREILFDRPYLATIRRSVRVLSSSLYQYGYRGALEERVAYQEVAPPLDNHGERNHSAR